MSDPQADIKSNAAKINELNDTVRFTMWSVFKLERPIGGDDVVRKSEAAEVEALLAELAAEDVVVRGVYDVAGLRAAACAATSVLPTLLCLLTKILSTRQLMKFGSSCLNDAAHSPRAPAVSAPARSTSITMRSRCSALRRTEKCMWLSAEHT